MFLNFIFILGLIVSGCPPSETTPPTNTELLSRTWQIAVVASNNISERTDSFGISFVADGTYTINNPDNVPQPNNIAAGTTQRTEGEWVF